MGVSRISRAELVGGVERGELARESVQITADASSDESAVADDVQLALLACDKGVKKITHYNSDWLENLVWV